MEEGRIFFMADLCAVVTTAAQRNQTLVPEAEEQLHRHVKPLVIGSNPVCPTYGTVAQFGRAGKNAVSLFSGTITADGSLNLPQGAKY